MRYGAFIPQGWQLDLVGVEPRQQWNTMLGVARVLESAGYESAWVYDHFHTVPVPSQEATYEAWSLMSALAVTTETIRLGQMCTANSYRMPSYLAKVAAGVDVMSGGRLEMGIGAGWYEHEYRGYGYEFPKASVRIGQLREGVEIMRRMWTEDEVSFEGEYYTLDGAICRPRPLQQPHIPIWVAGGGEKLTLRVAARFADYTNFAMSVEEFAHKSTVLAEHCRTVGRDFDTIVRSTNSDIVIGETTADVAERMDWIRAHYEPYLGAERANRYAGRLVESHLVGTPEQIVEQLRPWVAAGMTYLIGYFHEAAYDTAGMELFAAEVAPAFS